MEDQNEMTKKVGAKEQQKLKARKKKGNSIWIGLGMIGTVGWMVAIPTLAGTLLGVWIQSLMQGRFPWVLVFMLGGLFMGLVTAGIWVMREQRSIQRDREVGEDE